MRNSRAWGAFAVVERPVLSGRQSAHLPVHWPAVRRHAPAVADAAVPPPRVPHPEWMPEPAAAAALASSHRRRLLGRW